jgi:hypothetical protein
VKVVRWGIMMLLVVSAAGRLNLVFSTSCDASTTRLSMLRISAFAFGSDGVVFVKRGSLLLTLEPGRLKRSTPRPAAVNSD